MHHGWGKKWTGPGNEWQRQRDSDSDATILNYHLNEGKKYTLTKEKKRKKLGCMDGSTQDSRGLKRAALRMKQQGLRNSCVQGALTKVMGSQQLAFDVAWFLMVQG